MSGTKCTKQKKWEGGMESTVIPSRKKREERGSDYGSFNKSCMPPVSNNQ